MFIFSFFLLYIKINGDSIAKKTVVYQMDEHIFSVDINECSINNGGCSHQCNNIPGSFYCGCPEGTTMAANNFTCVGK